MRVTAGRAPLLATAQELLPSRAVTLARLGRTVLTPHFYPRAPIVKTFWWSEKRNFGDLIGPILLEKHGVIPLLKPPYACDIVGAGSILELLPSNFAGVVWGSGKMHADVVTTLPDAHITAVRGVLTRDLIGASESTPIGDPGLLIGDYVQAPASRDRSPIGLIAHFSHRAEPWFDHLRSARSVSVRDIDVRRSPLSVAQDIAKCRAIVSTSLHGVIVADALGVPAVWALPMPTLAGAEFKFLDHESAVNPHGVNRRVTIDSSADPRELVSQAWSPDPAHVAMLKRGLRESLAHALEILQPTESSPLAVPAAQRRP